MELVDIYNKNRQKIGIKDRHSLEDKEFLIGVRAVILNSNHNILITKRSEAKKIEPLKWECNGGAVKTGESPIEALKRELKEELGLNLKNSDITFYTTITREKEFTDIFIVNINNGINELSFTDQEVSEAKFVTKDEFKTMLENNQFVFNEIISIEMLDNIIEFMKKD